MRYAAPGGGGHGARDGQGPPTAAGELMGQPDDADRHFHEAVNRFERRIARGADDPATKYYIASLYGLRGDTEKATRYLRETLAELPALNRARAEADPDFDPIRSNAAFVQLLAADRHPAA